MTTKLVDSAGLGEFSSKIKEKAVFIGNSQSGNLGLLDLIYPVGSIYMSVNNVSPQTFIGGTWGRIQDTFLLAAGSTYAAGSTGGEATHKLTTNEMPSHSHDIFAYASDPVGTPTQAENSRMTVFDRDHGWNMGSQGNIIATGGDQPHNNMPPYLTVYMWKRTA